MAWLLHSAGEGSSRQTAGERSVVRVANRLTNMLFGHTVPGHSAVLDLDSHIETRHSEYNDAKGASAPVISLGPVKLPVLSFVHYRLGC